MDGCDRSVVSNVSIQYRAMFYTAYVHKIVYYLFDTKETMKSIAVGEGWLERTGSELRTKFALPS